MSVSLSNQFTCIYIQQRCLVSYKSVTGFNLATCCFGLAATLYFFSMRTRFYVTLNVWPVPIGSKNRSEIHPCLMTGTSSFVFIQSSSLLLFFNIRESMCTFLTKHAMYKEVTNKQVCLCGPRYFSSSCIYTVFGLAAYPLRIRAERGNAKSAEA